MRFLCTAVIVFGIPIIWSSCGDAPPQQHVETALPDPLRIEITGAEYQWHIRYAGLDGTLGTEDDRYAVRHVHIPAAAAVELTLRSEDYLYSFALPEQNVNQIAVPDLTFDATVETSQIGTYELRGDQFCGFAHPDLSGMLVVESQPDFLRWLKSLPRYDRPSTSAEGG